MDIATIKLADSYDALKAACEKASKAKADAVAAETKRQESAMAEIQKLVDAETKAVQTLARSGEARIAIHRSVPHEIQVALENAQSELRQHAGALSGAELILKEQKKHHAKLMERVNALPLENDPANPGKQKLSQRAEYEKNEADAALKGALATLQVETDRVAGFKAKIAKLEKERDTFLKEVRAKAEKLEKEKASAK